MKDNFVKMVQINNKANRALSEMEIEKQNRQRERNLENRNRMEQRKTEVVYKACIICVMLIIVAFTLGTMIKALDLTFTIPLYTFETETETVTEEVEVYIPDKYTTVGVVKDATETGCIIVTFDELDGHEWYWEFTDTVFYNGEKVAITLDRCYGAFIEDYVILDVNY